MNGLKKRFKDIILIRKFFSASLGLVFVASLMILFQNPLNQYAVLAICISAGLMNVQNGIKYMEDSKKKTMGMTSLMMGAIVILLGFLIMDIL